MAKTRKMKHLLLKMYFIKTARKNNFEHNFGNKPKFDSIIKNISKTYGQKLNAFSRISTFLNKDKKSIIFNVMIKSQLSYCPFILMFFSRQSNNQINKVHQRSLKLLQMMKTAVS